MKNGKPIIALSVISLLIGACRIQELGYIRLLILTLSKVHQEIRGQRDRWY